MKTVTRALALLISLLLAFTAASCGSDEDKKETEKEAKAVMTLGDCVITDEMFEYWMCSYKALFLQTYSDVKDTPEYWDTVLYGDTTVEEYLYDLTLNYIESNLVSMYLFDEYSLKLSDEHKKTAGDIIAELKKEYANDDAEAFDKLLSNFGTDGNGLLKIYFEELKSTYVYNHIFENGLLSVGDKEKTDYLNDNYVRIRQIYINNKYDYDNSHYDDSGNFVMAEIDDAVKAEKDAKVAEVKVALEAGEDFDELYEKYSEEKDYPSGYYLSASTSDLPTELVAKSMGLEEGEDTVFESEYGTHFIKRLEMDEKPWENEDNEVFFGDFSDDVYESVFSDFISSYYDKIEIDKSIVEGYSVRDALPNYSFQY